MNRIITTLTVSVLLISTANARNLPGKSGTKPTNNNSLQNKAANCSPATGLEILAENNVSALIETGGLMWQDRSQGRSAYEVPGGSGEYYIYSGALWMGGKDVNNQLKIAAQLFGQGRDFWTGPLTATPGTGNLSIGRLDYGAAEIQPDVCAEYDKFYRITRAQVTEFRAWFECSQDPNCNAAIEFPGYSIPSEILNWPAHGDVGRFQDYFLAPYYDHPNSIQGVYDPAGGDYPWYDLDKEVDCRTSRKVTLFGDYTMWWIFNDKGNIHTETNGDPIGMEIRAQAFAFSTNDAINNMTFYNYEMVNRSTQKLTDTYFAVYVDADIGFADNDYVGCDVSRGVGYAYNGPANDVGGTNALGLNPGAIGVDFFEGPYQDNDGIDNPLTTDVAVAIADKGIPYPGLGIGYGDGTIDNERLGMKRFTLFTRADLAPPYGADPTNAIDFYNYMEGYWTDGTHFTYGGNAHAGAVNSNYMYTGTSDPLFWSTGGIPATPTNWTEGSVGNVAKDRRFLQSAGPFTLEPGALNNITVGVIFGKTKDGNPFNSVLELLKADDKAQILFDNCFRIIDGPNAPDLTAQELDQEVILYLTNPKGSNNFNNVDEDYVEIDPNIIPVTQNDVIEYILDPITGQYIQNIVTVTTNNDQNYRFQGYQIFQMKNASVGPQEIGNTDLVRLVAQCDIKDGISDLVNYSADDDLGIVTGRLMVSGADDGIKHSFKITEDQFAQGNKRLINHKKYYYVAIAYGYNEYEPYHPTNSPDGQQKPYLPSRNTARGTKITSLVVIPHNPAPELGGTVALAEYGYGPKITRVEGQGNAGAGFMEITEASELDILNHTTPKKVTYKNGKGPIDVSVIDPLNVKRGDYTIKFIPDANNSLDSATWVISRSFEGNVETVSSNNTIALDNDQLIPEWGISVKIKQYQYEKYTDFNYTKTEFLESRIVYTDSSKQWLSGVKDQDLTNLTSLSSSQNWIASGSVTEASDNQPACESVQFFNDEYYGSLTGTYNVKDLDQDYEKILEGTWAPFVVTREGDCYNTALPKGIPAHDVEHLSYLSSVDIVFTKDKSKWTRVPVFETQDNPALSWDGATEKLEIKLMPSRDKNGKRAGQSGYNSNEGDFNGSQPLGMSWFPGYAIDIESGERLNMAFGEDSWLGNENGNDMIFNPTSTLFSGISNEVRFGGKHYVYVFKNDRKSPNSQGPLNSSANFNNASLMPAYDNGTFMHQQMINTNLGTASKAKKLWKSCMWVGMPMLSESAAGLTDVSDPFSYIETDARIQIRVANAYARYSNNNVWVDDASSLGQSLNNWFPLYEFNMDDIATTIADGTMADSALAMINVVPNPYYAYSNYEFNRLDNVVKVVNLPDVCTVRIYNVSGTLLRTFEKDSPITSIDWDLKNYVGIPIASGIYLIHVEVPGVGERVLKWYGVVRPPDLDNF